MNERDRIEARMLERVRRILPDARALRGEMITLGLSGQRLVLEETIASLENLLWREGVEAT